jgi:hypothetical protein
MCYYLQCNIADVFCIIRRLLHYILFFPFYHHVQVSLLFMFLQVGTNVLIHICSYFFQRLILASIEPDSFMWHYCHFLIVKFNWLSNSKDIWKCLWKIMCILPIKRLTPFFYKLTVTSKFRWLCIENHVINLSFMLSQ